MEIFLPLALGMMTGLLLGLTGAGGGILAAPLLVLIMHLPVSQAAPASLIAVFIGASVGAALGLREGVVRYKAAMLMAVTGLLAFPLGHALVRYLPNTLLIMLFVLLLGYQAWRSWQGNATTADDTQPCDVSTTSGRFIWTQPCALAFTRSGLAAGFLSGLLGVGGGFILVPALRRYTPLETHSITATTLLVLALVSCGGFLQWSVGGGVVWKIAIPFAAGAAFGMVCGREFSPKLEEHLLRRIFAVFCGSIGLSLLVKLAISI